MPSFDVVSEVNLAEVDNAVQNVTREISTRYDFKGSKSKVDVKNGGLTVFADDELKLKQVHDCLLYTSPSPRDLSTSRMPSSA